MKNMKKFLALLMAMVMVLALAACGSSKTESVPAAQPAETQEQQAPAEETASDTDMTYVQDKGVLVVGITDFEPMDYKDADGNWIGFDADMATAFAESLGVDVEFVEIDWDNKVLELDSKTIDCVWNGMTLTAEVTSAMECSNAYCNNAQVVVVSADVADQYQDEASLAGLKFAVEAGSAGEDAVIELGNEYTAVLTQADALMEVAAGTSDACIIDLLMAGAMIGEGTSYPEMTYTVKLTTEEYGVGFKIGSGLAEKFNEFYAKAYADGTVMEIAEKYGVQESIIAK